MCLKYKETNLPEGYTMHVHHWHDGNSSRRMRHGHAYVTEAWITRENEPTAIVARGRAECSKKDKPRRDLGRRIAVGRAMRELIGRDGYIFDVPFNEPNFPQEYNRIGEL